MEIVSNSATVNQAAVHVPLKIAGGKPGWVPRSGTTTKTFILPDFANFSSVAVVPSGIPTSRVWKRLPPPSLASTFANLT